jgi:hypothetical protein
MKYLFYSSTFLCVFPFAVSGLLDIRQQKKSSTALKEIGISYITPVLLGSLKITGAILVLLPFFKLLNLSGYCLLLILTGFKFYYNRRHSVPLLNFFLLALSLLLLNSAVLKYRYLPEKTTGKQQLQKPVENDTAATKKCTRQKPCAF